MPEIEIFADIWCPFAHVGIRAVLARSRELDPAPVPLRIRAWPLELVNGARLDPGVTTDHVVELREQCAPDLFRGFNPASFPTTSLPALNLAAAAYRVSSHRGEAVSLALRDALFEEGRDIADAAVLGEIASSHGSPVVSAIDHETVMSDWRAGQGRDVKGSPHFFCGELGTFCPSLDISKSGNGHVIVRRDPAALDAFLTACLRPKVARLSSPTQ